MGTNRRVTLKCLTDDLSSQISNRSEQVGLKRLVQEVKDRSNKGVGEALSALPPLHLLDSNVLRNFEAVFSQDGSAVNREPIRAITSRRWFKLKSGRFRGAVTQLEGVYWLCAAGIRRDGSPEDFYQTFPSQAANRLPTNDDDYLLSIEEKLSRLQAWQLQLSTSLLIQFHKAMELGTPQEFKVNLVGLGSEDSPARIEIDVIKVHEGSQTLCELIVTVNYVKRYAAANLLENTIQVALGSQTEEWGQPSGNHDQTRISFSIIVDSELVEDAGRVFRDGHLINSRLGFSPRLGLRSHYVHKNTEVLARIDGNPVPALCGKWFVPTRNSDGLDICETCLREHGALKR